MNDHDDHHHEPDDLGDDRIDQAFNEMVRQDPAGPNASLIATTRSSMRLALARRRRQRWLVRGAVGIASTAAGVIIAFAAWPTATTQSPHQVAERPQPPTPTTTEVARSDEPGAGNPSHGTLIGQADREQIRRSLARMTLRRTWDDPGGLQSRELSKIRRRIRRLSEDLSDAPRSTQPAGSTKKPAPTKELRHA